MFSSRRSAWALSIMAFLCVSAAVSAQQTPQMEDQSQIFRSQSNVVLVPALVLDKSGDIVRGFTATDFIIEEDGIEQDVHLDEAPDEQAISLVVAVQRGRSAYLELQGWQVSNTEPKGHKKSRDAALSGLGSMIENLLGVSNSEVAVVTFDSGIDVFQSFTSDVESAVERLADLTPSGDSGAAILDAVAYSEQMLERRPKGRTRVLLLISEERDHGSQTKLTDVVEHVAQNNVLIYSIAFSPLRSETIRDLKGENRQSGPNLLKLLGLASDAIQKNTAKAVATLTGGEYSSFKNKKSFDEEMGTLANHLRGRYLLSFQPKNTQPGAHRFVVRLRSPLKDAVVLARNSYWVAESAK